MSRSSKKGPYIDAKLQAKVEAASRGGERRVGVERATIDRVADPHEVLHHDASGAKVEVSHFAVADLPFGQSDGESRRVEQCVRRPRRERVPCRHGRERDRVTFAFRPVPPTIKNDEYDRTLGQTDSLWWNVRC